MWQHIIAIGSYLSQIILSKTFSKKIDNPYLVGLYVEMFSAFRINQDINRLGHTNCSLFSYS